MSHCLAVQTTLYEAVARLLFTMTSWLQTVPSFKMLPTEDQVKNVSPPASDAERLLFFSVHFSKIIGIIFWLSIWVNGWCPWWPFNWPTIRWRKPIKWRCNEYVTASTSYAHWPWISTSTPTWKPFPYTNVQVVFADSSSLTSFAMLVFSFHSQVIDQSKSPWCMSRTRSLLITNKFNVSFSRHVHDQIQSTVGNHSNDDAYLRQCRAENLLPQRNLQRARGKDPLGTLSIEIPGLEHINFTSLYKTCLSSLILHIPSLFILFHSSI